MRLFSVFVITFLIAFGVTRCAKADLITEFGGGVKFSTSDVLQPSCAKVILTTHPDRLPEYQYDDLGYVRTWPCGGNNPVFVGWPLAWDFPNGVRFGWFHLSNWFDGGEFDLFGGDEYESQLNCLCASKTINWSERRRGRIRTDRR